MCESSAVSDPYCDFIRGFGFKIECAGSYDQFVVAYSAYGKQGIISATVDCIGRCVDSILIGCGETAYRITTTGICVFINRAAAKGNQGRSFVDISYSDKNSLGNSSRIAIICSYSTS